MNFRIATPEMIRQVIGEAARSERSRAGLPLHPNEATGARASLLAIRPESYIQPHRHNETSELLFSLRGSLGLVLFDNDGKLVEKVRLGLGKNESSLVEIPQGAYHTAVALNGGAVLYEVSQGPYDAAKYKEVAPWAPDERDANAGAYFRLIQEEFGS